MFIILLLNKNIESFSTESDRICVKLTNSTSNERRVLQLNAHQPQESRPTKADELRLTLMRRWQLTQQKDPERLASIEIAQVLVMESSAKNTGTHKVNL